MIPFFGPLFFTNSVIRSILRLPFSINYRKLILLIFYDWSSTIRTSLCYPDAIFWITRIFLWFFGIYKNISTSYCAISRSKPYFAVFSQFRCFLSSILNSQKTLVGTSILMGTLAFIKVVIDWMYGFVERNKVSC